MRTTSSVLCLSVLLAVPSLAAASEVVLPPLVPRGATTVQQVANITQLMSSEMDFMGEVDRVIELQKAPPGYNSACVDSASCLTRVGRDAGGDYVVAGTLRTTDATVYMDLVYYDASRGRYIRRKSFELDNQPEIIADNMDDVVKELITGEAPKVDDALADDFDLLNFDDDLDLGFDESDFAEARRDEEAERARREAEARRQREAQAKAAAEAEARRRAQAAEQARLDEQRRKAEAAAAARQAAEEEARRRAQAEERRIAELEAERRAAAERDTRAAAEREARARRAAEEERLAAQEADEVEFDPSMISFGDSSIIVEDQEPDVVEEAPVRTRQVETPSYFEDLDDEDDAVVDLDEPVDYEPVDYEPARVDKPAPEKTRREKVVRDRPAREQSGFDGDPTAAQLTLRGGYNPYFKLGFVTYGGELSLALGDSGVRALVGVEAWSVQRSIPERFQAQAGAPTEWNTIVPLSAGVVYAFDVADGRVKPYLGGDVIGARYYSPEEGGGLGAWSVGARGRAGLDLMVVRNFGINLNAGVGFWSGKDWVVIEKDVRNAGLLPQVSAGTVFAF